MWNWSGSGNWNLTILKGIGITKKELQKKELELNEKELQGIGID